MTLLVTHLTDERKGRGSSPDEVKRKLLTTPWPRSDFGRTGFILSPLINHHITHKIDFCLSLRGK